ncbi:orotidine-5'-phosphate decarboxylase [Bacillus timonensis]|nr:orotidine-5'-phosphate decarboxylase [Bacillus timonensis]
MRGKLIVALDFPNMTEVRRFLDAFESEKEPLFLKVGMELYFQEGPAVIAYLKERGHSIFLDLKLHDIPNTVKSAMKGLARLDVDLVNVHASGGKAMMEAAIEGLDIGTKLGRKRPGCIAVTQLTSTSEIVMQEELWISRNLNDTVLHYATLAKASGLDGVVCSALEATSIHERLGEEFITVTPGIRLTSDQLNDQTRVVTPEDAKKLGSSSIVVGRSITTSENPMETYRLMKNAWEGVKI